MKVALCLYGQPRDAHNKVSSIYENVVGPNQCDVFFHAWYDPSNLSIDKMTPGHEARIIHPGMDRFVVDAYRPKSYEIEKQRRFHHKNFEATDENIEACWSYSKNYDRDTFVRHKATCIHSMWYSIMRSITLKELYANENGFVYDAVILSRFDVSPTSKIKVSDYDLESITTRSYEYPRGEVSDWFMFSNDRNMNVIGSTFFHVESLYKRIIDSETKIWTNEAFLRDILSMNKIRVERGEFDVTF